MQDVQKIAGANGKPCSERWAVEVLMAGNMLQLLGADVGSHLPKQFARLENQNVVLAQLWRVAEEQGKAAAITYAKALAESNLSAQTAVVRLRAARDRQKAIDIETMLTLRIARTIDRYRAERPGVSNEDILRALDRVQAAVADES